MPPNFESPHNSRVDLQAYFAQHLNQETLVKPGKYKPLTTPEISVLSPKLVSWKQQKDKSYSPLAKNQPHTTPVISSILAPKLSPFKKVEKLDSSIGNDQSLASAEISGAILSAKLASLKKLQDESPSSSQTETDIPKTSSECYWYMPSSCNNDKAHDKFAVSQVQKMYTIEENCQENEHQTSSYWDWYPNEETKDYAERAKFNSQIISIDNIKVKVELHGTHQVNVMNTKLLDTPQYGHDTKVASSDYFYSPSYDEEKAQKGYREMEEEDFKKKQELQDSYWDW